MSSVNYVVEYEYATLGLVFVLLGLYCARRKYPGTSNKIYAGMLLCTFLSALLNIVSVKTLAISELLPLWLNYAINILYLLAYNFEGALFLLYINALAKRNRLSKVNLVISSVVYSAEMLLLSTTPFTRLIIYFDENMQYQHGTLFNLLAVLAFAVITYATVLFVKYAMGRNRTQAVVVILFEVLTFGASAIQLFRPEQLLGNFAIALSLIMFMIVLQNPDDFTDKSADCFNREAFFLSVEVRIDSKKPFTAVAVRFNGSDYVNGLFGVGDMGEAARAISKRLRRDFGTDEVYHLGRCEFAMFTNDRRGITEQYIADRLTEHFSKPVNICGIEAVLTPKICLVRYPDFALSAEDVRDAIEYTLNNSNKADGTVFVATSESIMAKKRELHVLTAIKTAIVNRSFEMYYQPIYEPAEKGFVCAEALIRMNDRELGFVSPDEFIPLAEANGMMLEVGEIAFRKVCEFMRSGRAQALGVKYIEVNLSALQCVQEQLADDLMSIMAEYDIPPEQINFEITETAGLANYDVLLKNMNRLIAEGVTFSMDDYGTGFSTANYLITLPMDIVKIDKSILWPAMENDEAFVILRHTVEMLKSLRKKIVVEGVETAEMVKLLTDMGCDYLQGFYYQKPVPADEYIRYLEVASGKYRVTAEL